MPESLSRLQRKGARAAPRWGETVTQAGPPRKAPLCITQAALVSQFKPVALLRLN